MPARVDVCPICLGPIFILFTPNGTRKVLDAVPATSGKRPWVISVYRDAHGDEVPRACTFEKHLHSGRSRYAEHKTTCKGGPDARAS